MIQGLDVPRAPEVRMDPVSEVQPGTCKGRYQQSNPGSYALVGSLGFDERDRGLSITLYFQPYLLDAGHAQTLLSTLDSKSTTGVSVFIDTKSHLQVRLGDGQKFHSLQLDYTLLQRQWMRIQLSMQSDTLEIAIEPIAYLGQTRGKTLEQTLKLPSPLKLPHPGRLTIGATQTSPDANASDFFNGRIQDVQISTLVECPRQILDLGFSLKIPTDEVIDVSGYGNHGTLINAPTRAIPGYDWDGVESDWSKAPYGYGAIHFHEDGLDDAKWEADFTIRIPPGSQSEAYAVEVRNADDPSVHDYIIFFVRPDTRSSTAKLAFVLSTFTYTAYANERLYDTTRSSALVPAGEFHPRPADEHFRRMKRRGDLGLSLYDVHRDGTGTVFSSTKRPILNIRPGFHHWALDRPREFSADLIMIGLLEKLGIPYDVTTDHDLHYHGVAALEPYSTILTGSHPEYPSIESLNAYSGFAARGGNIMYLGGNGFYWRSMPDPANPHRLEVRRGDQGVRIFGLPGSERHHSLNGRRGGLWRGLGRAANYLFAMGCCGEGVGPGVPYKRTAAGKDNRHAWVFEGLDEDELIGEYGFAGGASGDEIDRWDPLHGSPEDAVVLASSTGHPDEFVLFPEDFGFQQTNITGTGTDMIRSDLVLYETPGEGACFRSDR